MVRVSGLSGLKFSFSLSAEANFDGIEELFGTLESEAILEAEPQVQVEESAPTPESPLSLLFGRCSITDRSSKLSINLQKRDLYAALALIIKASLL